MFVARLRVVSKMACSVGVGMGPVKSRLCKFVGVGGHWVEIIATGTCKLACERDRFGVKVKLGASILGVEYESTDGEDRDKDEVEVERFDDSVVGRTEIVGVGGTEWIEGVEYMEVAVGAVEEAVVLFGGSLRLGCRVFQIFFTNSRLVVSNSGSGTGDV